ncbi:MAG: hypothetical protein GF375_04835 [Candidatus Omnitrophica bacterium]|nr:hypothetical protein [Candidatus Omnitrophota bacterium]MBD3269353.1 hypothetical protein [Candidatus Omnitrophota bacterium]
MRRFNNFERKVLQILTEHKGERIKLFNLETEGVKASTILKEACKLKTEKVIEAVVELTRKGYIQLLDPQFKKKQDLNIDKLLLKKSTGSMVINFVVRIRERGIKALKFLQEKEERKKAQEVNEEGI